MEINLSQVQAEFVLPDGVTVGRHSYGYQKGTFRLFMDGARIEMGTFCSIGSEVRILAGSEHITTRTTTFPLNALLFDPAKGNPLDVIDKGTTTIGNYVWIGLSAVVLSGVTVGDGAVIGAGSVISKSVPPYAVVVGNPAHIIRYRFPEEIRRRLLRCAWWYWSDEEIMALRPAFMADVDSFLKEVERLHSPHPESDLNRRLCEMRPEQLTPHRGNAQHVADPQSRIADPEAQIVEMRSTAAWRRAMRYWRLRARLLGKWHTGGKRPPS
jgi:acetyltransferase-like isoleucine patch superfamily enzyme